MPQVVDVFGEAPFRWMELTNVTNRIVQRPTLLGRLGVDLFRPVTTPTGSIVCYETYPFQRLISTSPLGSPPENVEKRGGRFRRFGTHRLAKGFTINGYELPNILQQPLFQAVQTVQGEVALRSQIVRDDFALTLEYHRLGAVTCRSMDADGVTVLHDWYDEWGKTPNDPFWMCLDDANIDLRLPCRQLVNFVKDKSYGSWIEGVSKVHVLCGDKFFTKFITHPSITRTYLAYAAAAELRNEIADRFEFANIVFHDYRSAVDPRFGMSDETARYFPVGAGDTFQDVRGPGEYPPYLGIPVPDLMTITFDDPYRKAWTRVESHAYPLLINMRPEMCGEIRMGSPPGALGYSSGVYGPSVAANPGNNPPADPRAVTLSA